MPRLPFFIGYGLCVIGYDLRVMGYDLCVMHNALCAARDPTQTNQNQPCATQLARLAGTILIGGTSVGVWHYLGVREIPCVARRFRWSTNKWSK